MAMIKDGMSLGWDLKTRPVLTLQGNIMAKELKWSCKRIAKVMNLAKFF